MFGEEHSLIVRLGVVLPHSAAFLLIREYKGTNILLWRTRFQLDEATFNTHPKYEWMFSPIHFPTILVQVPITSLIPRSAKV